MCYGDKRFHVSFYPSDKKQTLYPFERCISFSRSTGQIRFIGFSHIHTFPQPFTLVVTKKKSYKKTLCFYDALVQKADIYNTRRYNTKDIRVYSMLTPKNIYSREDPTHIQWKETRKNAHFLQRQDGMYVAINHDLHSLFKNAVGDSS